MKSGPWNHQLILGTLEIWIVGSCWYLPFMAPQKLYLPLQVLPPESNYNFFHNLFPYLGSCLPSVHNHNCKYLRTDTTYTQPYRLQRTNFPHISRSRSHSWSAQIPRWTVDWHSWHNELVMLEIFTCGSAGTLESSEHFLKIWLVWPLNHHKPINFSILAFKASVTKMMVMIEEWEGNNHPSNSFIEVKVIASRWWAEFQKPCSTARLHPSPWSLSH